MAQSTRRNGKAFDERLLTHHPAGKAFFEACNANGWQPGNADVLRMVHLWDEVRQGRRSEDALSPARLEFARWLVQHGRLNEEAEEHQGRLDRAA